MFQALEGPLSAVARRSPCLPLQRLERYGARRLILQKKAEVDTAKKVDLASHKNGEWLI